MLLFHCCCCAALTFCCCWIPYVVEHPQQPVVCQPLLAANFVSVLADMCIALVPACRCTARVSIRCDMALGHGSRVLRGSLCRPARVSVQPHQCKIPQTCFAVWLISCSIVCLWWDAAVHDAAWRASLWLGGCLQRKPQCITAQCWQHDLLPFFDVTRDLVHHSAMLATGAAAFNARGVLLGSQAFASATAVPAAADRGHSAVPGTLVTCSACCSVPCHTVLTRRYCSM